MNNQETARRLANMYFSANKSENFRAVKVFLDSILQLNDSTDRYSRTLVETAIKAKLDSNKVWRGLHAGKSPTW